MAWYGPQGDCGCCEDGQCDPVGLTTDDFTAVNPRWNLRTGSSTVVEVDTSKPGMRFHRPDPNTLNGEAWRCHASASTASESIVRVKLKLLSDLDLQDPVFGSSIDLRFGVFTAFNDAEEDPLMLVNFGFRITYSSFTSGWTNWQTIGNQVPSSTSTAMNPGDELEMTIEATKVGLGHDFYVEWYINASSVRSDTFYGESMSPNIASAQLLTGEMVGLGSLLEFWNQEFEFESEIIAP